MYREIMLQQSLCDFHRFVRIRNFFPDCLNILMCQCNGLIILLVNRSFHNLNNISPKPVLQHLNLECGASQSEMRNMKFREHPIPICFAQWLRNEFKRLIHSYRIGMKANTLCNLAC